MESSRQKGDGFTISISPPIPLSLLSENEKKDEKSPPPDQIKESPTPGNLESQIGRCFAGKSVFLTGVTGYVTDLKKYVLRKEHSDEEAEKKLLRLYMISRGVQIFGIILLFLVVGRLIAISITGF